MVNGRVFAIRVQDVNRQLWFNWDYPNAWDANGPPSCRKGAPIYVAVYVENTGADGGIVVSLVNADSGVELNSKGDWVLQNGTIGLEWNGIMPNIDFRIRCLAIDQPYV